MCTIRHLSIKDDFLSGTPSGRDRLCGHVCCFTSKKNRQQVCYRQEPEPLAYGYGCTYRRPIKKLPRMLKRWAHPPREGSHSLVRHTPPAAPLWGSDQPPFSYDNQKDIPAGLQIHPEKRFSVLARCRPFRQMAYERAENIRHGEGRSRLGTGH